MDDVPMFPAVSVDSGGGAETDLVQLQRGKDTIPTAYPEKEIAAWAGRLRSWAEGNEPDDLPRVEAASSRKPAAREVFAYVIHEGKICAPAGAMALIARLDGKSQST